MNVLDGGTLPNVSDQVRSVVEEQAVLVNSLVIPGFQADVNTCGLIPQQDQVGTTEFVFQLETLRGRGPRVCVKTTRTAFKGSYLNAQMSLERGVKKVMDADVRAQMYVRSGIKATINTNYGFSGMLNGDVNQINTLFPSFAPNASVSFQFLYRLISHMREDLLVEPFEGNAGQGSEGEPVFHVIGSVDVLDQFRNELGLKDDMRALSTGRYTLGEKSIAGYTWKGPYRGLTFGVDSQPLRCNNFINGQPQLIEPEIGVATTKGVGARTNPLWLGANYEILFVAGANSFRRLTPEQYTGEGTFKFAPQMWMGELIWRYIVDNDCNLFGDFGQHIYQIMRAYQPFRPHAIIPVVYQRCPVNLNLPTCTSSTAGL